MAGSPDAVRADLDRVLAAQTDRVAAATADFVAGRSNLAAWELAMRDVLKPLHLAAAAAGAGGDRQIAHRVAAPALRAQYRYLEGLRVALRRGTQARDASLGARAALYVQAARGTFGQAVRAAAPPGSQERRVLTPAEHCRDCLVAAQQGWQPLGTLPRIGASACMVQCRCYFEIRTGAHGV